ncbi:MAG: hypothetical protein IPK58_24885 [Acidobacteria bacterium]|nr:hypothetical protein [Acidobacteriota bacterium]
MKEKSMKEIVAGESKCWYGDSGFSQFYDQGKLPSPSGYLLANNLNNWHSSVNAVRFVCIAKYA